MSVFHLRVTHRSEADREKNTDFIRRLACKDKLHVAEISKNEGKPHTHTLFTDTRSLSAVRAEWKQKFPDYDGKHKKEYQLVNVGCHDLQITRQYLCKGAGQFPKHGVLPDVLLQTGFYTKEKVVELHDAYWRFGGPGSQQTDPSDSAQLTMSSFTITLPPQTVARKEKTKKPNFYESFIQSINLKYREESGGHNVDRDWKLTDTPLVLKELLRHHGKNFRPYDVSLFEKEMNLIMGILTFDSHWSDFYEQLKNRRNIPHL